MQGSEFRIRESEFRKKRGSGSGGRNGRELGGIPRKLGMTLSRHVGIIVLSVLIGGSVSGEAQRLNTVLGYDRQVNARPVMKDDVLMHVSGGGGSIHSWLHVQPGVLSWIAIIGGGALIASGVASDNNRYRKGAIITGSILAPFGIWGAFFRSDSPAPELVEESTVRDYETVMKAMFQSRPDDRQAVEDLIGQYPELHMKLLFSMRALRNPSEETPAESAFIDWYLSFGK